jgi:hypothetical protein
MRGLLLAAAPLAALMIPTSAQAAMSGHAAVGATDGVTVHRGGVGHGRPEYRDGAFACQQRGGNFDRGHGRRDGHGFVGDCGYFDAGLGYLDPGDYDANRSFNPDLWNDWWHERPWRSYPRWVQQQNMNCEPDRMWWSGSGWHC